MGIFDGLLSRMGYERRKAAPSFTPWQLATAQAESWRIPDPSQHDGQIELYTKLSWVNGAISIKSQAAAGQKLLVKRMDGEELVDVPNHEFERRMYDPNPLQSRLEFLEATYNYLDITGNAYWWLNRSSENEPPAELWIIPANMIRPVPDGRMFLRGYYYYPGDGQEMILEPWEVCHVKLFSGTSIFEGASRLEAVATQAWGDIGRVRNDAKLYNDDNGWLPAVMAFADRVNDGDWERLRREARDKANKRELMMLRGVGSGGVQWLQTTMSRNDMQYLESREFTRDEIYSIFAPGLASMTSPNATEANAKSGKATFTEFALWPMLERVAQRITKTILPAYGENLVAEFEDPRVKDRVLELKELQQYAQTHTIEEIRQKYYQDKPLGDERDKLLPVQIKAESGGIQEPPPNPLLQSGQNSQNEDDNQNQMNPREAGMMDEDQNQDDRPRQEQPQEDDEEENEVAKWRRKAVKRAKAGRFGAVEFESEAISAARRAAITAKLEAAKTIAEVEGAFVMDSPSGVDLAGLLAQSLAALEKYGALLNG